MIYKWKNKNYNIRKNKYLIAKQNNTTQTNISNIVQNIISQIPNYKYPWNCNLVGMIPPI
jgi:hypothetical protein